MVVSLFCCLEGGRKGSIFLRTDAFDTVTSIQFHFSYLPIACIALLREMFTRQMQPAILPRTL